MIKTKFLVAAIIVAALIAGCSYLVLKKVSEEAPLLPENVPPGVVTKAGKLEQDETWSGEVLIVDLVEVPAGITLTIEPGTKVKFKHYRHGYRDPEERMSLNINGKLMAVGTPDQPIWFTSDADEPMNGDWGTIRFYDAENGSIIKYAVVEFAEYSGINMWNSSPTISHTIVRWNNHEGIYAEYYSSPTIEYSMIYQNAFNGIAMEQFNENVVIRYNYIAYSGSSGIHHMASNSTIEHNVIVGKARGEVSAENNWWGTPDESAVAGRISAGPQVTVSYLPCSTERVSENPEIGEQITTNITFDYADLKPYDLGYTPGDQAKDRYPWVLPDDSTRRIIKRISSGDEMP